MNQSSAIPQWLEKALAEHKSEFLSRQIQEDWPKTPKVGELRVAYPMDLVSPTPRIIFVADVSPREGFVSAVLTSTDTDMATDWDLRFDPGETKLPYALILQLDIVGPLWFVQLGPPLGVLSHEILPSILRAAEGDANGLPEAKRGLPTRLRTGLRWAWKRHELAEFHNLTSDCASSLTEPEEQRAELIDCGLLDPSTTTDQCIVALLDHIESLEPHPPAILECLLSAGVLTVERWRDTLGIDAWNAIEPLIRKGVLLASSSTSLEKACAWFPERSSKGHATDALCRVIENRAIQGRRRVYLKTNKTLWKLKSDPGETAILAVDFPDHGRVQIQSHFLDEIVS